MIETTYLWVVPSLNNVLAKQTFVVDIGADIRNAAVVAFDSVWAGATPVIGVQPEDWMGHER